MQHARFALRLNLCQYQKCNSAEAEMDDKVGCVQSLNTASWLPDVNGSYQAFLEPPGLSLLVPGQDHVGLRRARNTMPRMHSRARLWLFGLSFRICLTLADLDRLKAELFNQWAHELVAYGINPAALMQMQTLYAGLRMNELARYILPCMCLAQMPSTD